MDLLKLLAIALMPSFVMAAEDSKLLASPSVGIAQSSGYHNNSAFQTRVAMKAIAKLELRGDERLLDIGSGDGRLSALLKERLPDGEVVAVDGSSAMVDFAKSHYQGIEFLLANAMELPFESEFDAITSFWCWNWLPDNQKGYDSVMRALKPGGKVLLVLPLAADKNLGTACDRLATSSYWREFLPDYRPNKFYFSAEQQWQFAQRAGLEVISSEIGLEEFFFQDKQALIEWIEPLTPCTERLPSESMRRAFLEELASAIDEWPPDPEQPAKVLWRMMTLLLQKR